MEYIEHQHQYLTIFAETCRGICEMIVKRTEVKEFISDAKSPLQNLITFY
ncbi:hypothetical protein MA16_Dca012201 [Dendrobium catenatum]|uniref:Uncharacterized protein n=1 Tax=Dendrobium catenatum TaxID=906689 RepID=A0A2I0VPY9_9ASPA|nr:hypothetical protein MA16_Dca012201 [Dendrobium catenatum]